MESPAPSRRGRGRPPRNAAGATAPGARDRILESARAEFAARGYEKTSVRAVARAAGVDAALVHHYFGTKEEVFAAAVAAAGDPAVRGIAEVPLEGTADLGERLTRFFFGIWENPATREPLLAVLRSAVTNETAARIFRGFIRDRMMAHLATVLDGPDRELRVQLAASQLVGTAMLRYVLRMEPTASAGSDEIVRRLAPVVQHHLTGPAGQPEPTDGPGRV